MEEKEQGRGHIGSPALRGYGSMGVATQRGRAKGAGRGHKLLTREALTQHLDGCGSLGVSNLLVAFLQRVRLRNVTLVLVGVSTQSPSPHPIPPLERPHPP